MLSQSSSCSPDGPAPAGLPTPARDLAAVLGASVVFFAFATHFELSEKLATWAHRYESWQLDELPLTLLVLSLGLGWFGWRRWRQQRAELAARAAAERANGELLARNRALSRQLIGLQETEWRNIARELHDELSQYCNAIKVDARAIERDSREAGFGPARESALAIIDAADHIHDVVRNMLRRLRPEALDDLGLLACLQRLTESWAARNRIVCSLEHSGTLDTLPEALNIAVYRIVQECLTNIARHSGAHRAVVRISHDRRQGQGECVLLSVEDDGKNAAEQERHAHQGLGILGMTERALALGGSLQSGPVAQGGFRTVALLPVAWE